MVSLSVFMSTVFCWIGQAPLECLHIHLMYQIFLFTDSMHFDSELFID